MASGRLFTQENSLFMSKITKRENDAEEEELMRKYGGATDNQQKKGKKKKDGLKTAADILLGPDKGSNESEFGTGIQITKKKKGAKYTNLYTEEGQNKVMKLPGRHQCECQARRHELVNNCLKCGKIVCQQEGSGPCFFCGALVCTNDEQEILARGFQASPRLENDCTLIRHARNTAFSSKKSNELRMKLMAGAVPTDVENDIGSMSLSNVGKTLDESKALSNRDRLLAYDRDKTRRTKVIDDQSDYFQDSSNPWISKAERDRLSEKQKAMAEAMEQSRMQRKAKFTLDFTGKQILEEDAEWLKKEKYEESEEAHGSTSVQRGTVPDFQGLSAKMVNDENEFPVPDTAPIRLEYDEKYAKRLEKKRNSTKWPLQMKTNKPPPPELGKSTRIQDSHYGEMRDSGECLCVRQPYASLLISGLKKHEGRGWYTNHRGPLWIAAGSKGTTAEETQTVEQFYKRRYNNKLPMPLPTSYPTGCVIGRVFVKECLTEEEYNEKYPEGECDDPYILICENPIELHVKFPIRSKGGIFSLDPNVHKAAKKMIQGF